MTLKSAHTPNKSTHNLTASARLNFLLGHALAGAVSIVLILAVLLIVWLASGYQFDFAPRIAADFVVDKTPPDNALALEHTLGILARPSALLGGVMFVASLGMIGGIGYGLIKKRNRLLAVIVSAILTPAAVWFCFPVMTVTALLPLLLVGPLVDQMDRRRAVSTSPAGESGVLAGQGISRRAMLMRLGVFVVGGVAVAAVGSIPTIMSEIASGKILRRLFDFTPPKARVATFENVTDLSPEVTSVEEFYQMRKFATPIPSVPADWNLTVDGLVDHPLTFSLDDLINMPRTDVYLTRQCVSNPVGGPLMSTALMSGVPMKDILGKAGVKPGAVELVFYGRDGYAENAPYDEALERGLLVYAMNGAYLPEPHGAPLKVEIPGLYGFKNMKWLDRIEVVSKPHHSIWENEGWTKTAIVKTTSRIDSVYWDGSRVVMAGVAFAGTRSIKAVEVQVNDGEWQAATLHIPALSPETWVQWRAEIDQRGALTVRVRATDGTGVLQSPTVQKQFPDGASGYHTVKTTV